MRSQNIKVNNVGSFGSVGKVGCLGLLVLGLALVNPVMGSVYANGGSIGGDDTGSSGTGDTSKASSVQISFGDPVGVADLTPVSSNGASAKYSVKATVSVENSGGYVVYLGSNKSELVGKNTGTTINAVTGSSTYEGLPLNSWGYNAVEGETAGDSFQAIPTNNRGDIIGENTSNNIKSDEKTFTLSFATRIGNDKPADTYENEVTMSVVSSPLEITNAFGIETMQDMTSAICSSVANGTSDQLRDTRDGKYYWVSKLADGKCWMTQNLDLDLATNKPLTSADSDVTSNYTPVYNTATTATSSTIENVATAQRSWSLGNYRITNPNTSSDCGSGKNSAADCPTQFTSYTTPTSQDGDVNAHYILGNHYQWNTATAGTGGSITSGTASSSICPKGWRLPTSNTSGEFAALVTALGGTSSTNNVTQAPFYGVRGGSVYQNASVLFYLAGDYGFYWSSTPVDSNDYSAYNLSFNSTNSLNPSSSSDRQNGRSVRCLAR